MAGDGTEITKNNKPCLPKGTGLLLVTKTGQLLATTFANEVTGGFEPP